LWTICPGWLWNLILLISASEIARVTGMNHWRLAKADVLNHGWSLGSYILGEGEERKPGERERVEAFYCKKRGVCRVGVEVNHCYRMRNFLIAFLLLFWDTVLLCSPGWPQALNPFVSTSWMLGL
jgi:hypothetical protein